MDLLEGRGFVDVWLLGSWFATHFGGCDFDEPCGVGGW